MTEHPLLSRFLDLLRTALPEDDRVQALLSELPDELYVELAEHLTAQLSGLDVILALPDGLRLAEQISRRLSLPLVTVSGHTGGRGAEALQVEAGSLRQRPRGLLVSRELDGGVPEMEVAVMAQGLGCEVRGLACVLERSTSQGRHRLLQLGIQTHAAARIALIPSGWIIERRSLDSQRLPSERR